MNEIRTSRFEKGDVVYISANTELRLTGKCATGPSAFTVRECIENTSTHKKFYTLAGVDGYLEEKYLFSSPEEVII